MVWPPPPPQAARVALQFSGRVAVFNSTNQSATVADFHPPTIAWGDGLSSTGTIIALGSNGSFAVTGTHIYAEEAANTFQVSITPISPVSSSVMRKSCQRVMPLARIVPSSRVRSQE